MSEYTPITGELRDAMRQWGWVERDGSITFATSQMPPSIDAEKALAISGSDFDRCCDAIDAVHAQLERENEALKSSVAHAYASGYEHAEMDRDGRVELPKDADGVPIRVGDVMQMGSDPELREVVGFYEEGFISWLDGKLVPCVANLYRHQQPDTWERIIDDAEAIAREWFNTDMSENEHAEGLDAIVARCKALCERTKEEDE